MVARGRLVRSSALIGLSLLLVLAAGCGEDSSQPEEFAPERGGTNLTLTSSSCAYEGVSRVWRGPVEFVVANDGDEEGAFEVVRISEGASFEDLDRYIAEENERLAVGRAVRGEPSFVSVMSQLEVPATESAVLKTELGPGRYAVLCITGYPTSAVYAVAPLDVRAVSLSSTGGACVYEGPKSISPGSLSIDIENDGDDVQRFELLQVGRGGTYDDLVQHAEEQQQALAEGGAAPVADPAYVTVVDHAALSAGETGTLTGDATGNTYALRCLGGNPVTSIQVAAPLHVVG